MNIKNFLDQFNQTSARYQTIIEIVLVFLLVVLVILIGGAVLMLERPGQAQPPIIGWIDTPAITVDPPGGPVGTSVTVRGQGWTSTQSVLIYLVGPGQPESTESAIANVVVDSNGQFSTGFIVPAGSPWINGGPALVIAKSSLYELI